MGLNTCQAISDQLVLKSNFQEGKRLLDLLENLSISNDRLESRRQELQQSLYDFLATQESKSVRNPLEEEYRLDNLSHQIRLLCLDIAHYTTHLYYKSPAQPCHITLSSGDLIHYNYERHLQPAFLEQRLAGEVDTPTSWESEHVLVSSGMASLKLAIHSCLQFLKFSADSPAQVYMWGGYFETHHLLNMLSGRDLQWTRIENQADVWQKLIDGQVHILLLEPVCYDCKMDVLNVEAFSSVWHSDLSSYPQAIIIDTTLVHNTFSIAQFLDQFGDIPPPMIIQIRSGLKLDQQGLELSNVGLISVYRHKQVEKTFSSDIFSADQIGKFLRLARQTMGLGLSIEEVARLYVPFFLNRDLSLTYSKTVFSHNAKLAISVQKILEITPNSIFKHVIHPALSSQQHQPWANAPFVIFSLSEDTVENYTLLLAVLETERKKQGIQLLPGSSFGFRHHRFEVIWLRSKHQIALFKVAMGIRCGPSYANIISLLQHLASYSSYVSLAQSYPDAIKLVPTIRRYLLEYSSS